MIISSASNTGRLVGLGLLIGYFFSYLIWAFVESRKRRMNAAAIEQMSFARWKQMVWSFYTKCTSDRSYEDNELFGFLATNCRWLRIVGDCSLLSCFIMRFVAAICNLDEIVVIIVHVIYILATVLYLLMFQLEGLYIHISLKNEHGSSAKAKKLLMFCIPLICISFIVSLAVKMSLGEQNPAIIYAFDALSYLSVSLSALDFFYTFFHINQDSDSTPPVGGVEEKAYKHTMHVLSRICWSALAGQMFLMFMLFFWCQMLQHTIYLIGFMASIFLFTISLSSLTHDPSDMSLNPSQDEEELNKNWFLWLITMSPKRGLNGNDEQDKQKSSWMWSDMPNPEESENDYHNATLREHSDSTPVLTGTFEPLTQESIDGESL